MTRLSNFGKISRVNLNFKILTGFKSVSNGSIMHEERLGAKLFYRIRQRFIIRISDCVPLAKT